VANDRRNPILLYVHGGPGAAEMVESYGYQRPWEDFFTVVQWDQRGAGKTYASNAPEAMAPGMTVDGMVSDAEQVIRYLMSTYGKKKIFVLGIPGAAWWAWKSPAGTRSGSTPTLALARSPTSAKARRSAIAGRSRRPRREQRGGDPRPGSAGAVSGAQRAADDRAHRRAAAIGDVLRRPGLGRKDFTPFDDARKLSPDYSDEEVVRDRQGQPVSR
jgi:hypothetical protein